MLGWKGWAVGDVGSDPDRNSSGVRGLSSIMQFKQVELHYICFLLSDRTLHSTTLLAQGWPGLAPSSLLCCGDTSWPAGLHTCWVPSTFLC